MGSFLQIRVSASTFKPEDMLKAWPQLSLLAWPDSLDKMPDRCGVLELVEIMSSKVRLDMLEKDVMNIIEEPITRATYIARQLEKALGDWDAREANLQSDKLEDALAEAEKKLAGFLN